MTIEVGDEVTFRSGHNNRSAIVVEIIPQPTLARVRHANGQTQLMELESLSSDSRFVLE